MKISGIACTPFTLPLKNAITFGHGTLAETNHVLVEVHTDEGLIGRAEAPSRPYVYGESQISIIAAIKDWFEPALIGLDPFEIERAAQVFSGVQHNNTAKGAVDLALHDLMGQAVAMPCHRMLGGWANEVRVTYVCGAGDPEALADEATEMNATHSITAFKLKVGVHPEQDQQMLQMVRRQLPEALLYIDGNESFQSGSALRLLDAAADLDIAWAEEPCGVQDRVGRRRVAERALIPILGDESCRTLEETAREIRDQNVGLVSIKVARTGFRMSQRIYALCESNNIGPIVGSQGDSGIGVLAGLHFCAAHKLTQERPAELCFFLNLDGDLLAEPLQITGGKLRASDKPGLGIQIDPGKLEQFRIDKS